MFLHMVLMSRFSSVVWIFLAVVTMVPLLLTSSNHYWKNWFFKICVDQGFPRSGDADGILVGPYSQRSAARLSPILRPYLLKLSDAYVSLRQASEWEMRGLQGSLPRFKHRLPGNKKKMKYIIQSMVFIHNFRTHLMGCNQIKTEFDQEYERVITLNGNDRISRYYFNMQRNQLSKLTFC